MLEFLLDRDASLCLWEISATAEVTVHGFVVLLMMLHLKDLHKHSFIHVLALTFCSSVFQPKTQRALLGFRPLLKVCSSDYAHRQNLVFKSLIWLIYFKSTVVVHKDITHLLRHFLSNRAYQLERSQLIPCQSAGRPPIHRHRPRCRTSLVWFSWNNRGGNRFIHQITSRGQKQCHTTKTMRMWSILPGSEPLNDLIRLIEDTWNRL